MKLILKDGEIIYMYLESGTVSGNLDNFPGLNLLTQHLVLGVKEVYRSMWLVRLGSGPR